MITTAPGRLETATSSVPLSPERIVFRTFYGPAETAERARRVTVGPGGEMTGIDIAFALPPIDALRPGTAEKPVQFRGLPPGDFYVAALDHPENLEDPQLQNGPFFESLIASATRVTLAPGEHRSISVSVIGR